jgi:hypothetical protein
MGEWEAEEPVDTSLTDNRYAANSLQTDDFVVLLADR